jgi:hypothetical protein
MVFQTREGYSLRSVAEQGAAALSPSAFALPGPRVRASPFASISFGHSLGVVGSSPMLRKEAASGMEYPLELCHKAKPCAELSGLG